MAQVQEVSKEGLKRAYTVTVANDDIKKGVVLRLEEIGKTANIPGFRPGKIPMPVLEQRYGEAARAEVLDQTISNATDEALKERNLRPAMQPKIELVTFAEGKDVEFKLELEVLPEITPGDFSIITLERPVVEVEDKAVDEAIQRAAKQLREPELITEARAAAMGDVAVIDFDGSVDGEKRPGMKGEGHRLELGSKSFIDNFEEQIVGMKAGDSKTISVKFPDDYHAAELSGKMAEFEVALKELRASKPADLNDDLAKELGFESLDNIRARVKEDLGGNYASISRAIIKRELMDKLADMHTFEVPAVMLDREFTEIWAQIEAAKAKGTLPEEDKNKNDDELRTEYRDLAARRIRLGLLLADVAQKNSLNVESNELRNALMTEARRFPGQEKAVFDYYTKTEGALERLRAPLLEEKVIDFIISKSKVTDKTVDVETLTKLSQDAE